VVGVIVTQGHR